MGRAPASCAAGLAVLLYLEQEKLPAKVAGRSLALRDALAAALAGCPIVREVRGRGFLLGIPMSPPRRPLVPSTRHGSWPPGSTPKRWTGGCWCIPPPQHATATPADQTLLAPAFTATDEDLDEMVTRTAATVRSVATQVEADLL